MPNRLESLDWLRGMMALSIMLYHFGGKSDAATPLGRLGVYAVSIFFILSGLSMAIAYDRYIKDFHTAGMFFVRRLFRIWPLLWIAVALVAVPAHIAGKPYNGTMLTLNLSTLFGFIAPTQYINLGAWSIGNEMVYYALTPAFIAAYRWRTSAGNIMTALASAIGLVFAFHLLNPSSGLATQWAIYINPFNNLFLYCTGLAIYYNFRETTLPSSWHLPLLILSISSFFLYPASGDTINIVTGLNRVAMSLISAAVVFGFYKCAPSLPNFLSAKLEALGVATYGVYLLHPIVMDFVKLTLSALELHVRFIPTLLASGMTIVLALTTYRFIEAPFVRFGKRITQPHRQPR